MTTLTAIITCYKEGNLLNEALSSLFNQSDTDFDIILVNDCSPDETTNQICNRFINSEKVKVIWNEVNLGLSGSRNKAFENLENDVFPLLHVPRWRSTCRELLFIVSFLPAISPGEIAG